MAKATKAVAVSATEDNQQLALSVNTPVPDIIEQLDKALKNLVKIQETPWKTNGQFEGFPNIKDDRTVPVETLIRLESAVFGRNEAYIAAAYRLGKTSFKAFVVNGGTYEDWHHDINLAMQINEQKANYEKLKEFKEKISKFLSEEDQKASLLKQMASFLGQLPGAQD